MRPFNPSHGLRGRFVNGPKHDYWREHNQKERPADALHKDETISVPMPTKLEVLVYRSTVRGDRVSHVILTAKDIEGGETGTFGSEWRSPEKPTREQIRAHVVDMLDHEVRHQLGLEAHPEKK